MLFISKAGLDIHKNIEIFHDSTQNTQNNLIENASNSSCASQSTQKKSTFTVKPKTKGTIYSLNTK